ncbi:MAG: hypothetical protein IJ471_03335 [Eubacterium sp.]|nr:hypothetical protein [Eubacterium sp.]
MAALKIVRESGKYFDCTPMHGKWCDIEMLGRDIGFAQVGIISSGPHHIYFQYKDKRGVAPKMFVKQLVEVKMGSWRLKRQQELVVEEWDDSVHPYERFIGCKCDIHVHQTQLFEGNSGFFNAEILEVGNGVVKIREGSKIYPVNEHMICGMMESYSYFKI